LIALFAFFDAFVRNFMKNNRVLYMYLNIYL